MAKRVTVVNEPFYVNQEGDSVSFVPKEIKTSRDAYGASLHMLFKHVADVHLTLLEILAEKYKLSVDEMLQTVQDDPRWKDIHVNPVINSCTYVEATHPLEPESKVTPPASEKKARGRPKKVQEVPIDETTLAVEESTANPITVIKPKKQKQPSIFAMLKKEKETSS
jgi:hypothetical protein